MSDIDFDELDKAVNTLMSDVPKVEPPKTDDIKTLTITSTIHDDSRPSLAKLDATLTQVNSTPAKPAVQSDASVSVRATIPSLATRRSGRFMDVVHPSSDMKPATKEVPSSRQGITIKPAVEQSLKGTVDTTIDQKTDSEIAPEAYKDLTVADVSVQPKDDSSAPVERDIPTNDWPDPLEMSGYDGGSSNQPQASKEVEPVADTSHEEKDDDTVSAFSDSQFDTEDTQPLTSPFIPDAKVEKRPLGGVSTDAPTEELGRAPVLGVLAADDSSIEQPAENQLPVTPADVEVQLPPELQSDLMAIETDNGASAVDENKSDKSNTVAVLQSNAQPDSNVPTKHDSVGAPKPVAVAAATGGATSIPQQYQEAPSTSDEQSGSIYDTDSYHQPIAHPAKTKSGWLWIVWILLLLIVGGGGAVALYFIGVI